MKRRPWRTWGLRAAFVAAAGMLPVMFTHPVGAKSDDWVVMELKNPSGWPTVGPNSINKRGRIAGYRSDGTAPRAIVWPDADSDPIELEEMEGGGGSWSCLMNDRGLLPGFADYHKGFIDYKAVLWDRHGAIIKVLHDALDQAEYVASEGWVINRRRDVTGTAYTTAGYLPRAILWPWKGPAVTLEFDAAVYKTTVAYAMNDRGTICGFAGLLPSAKPRHAAYWPARGGPMVDLHTKVTEVMPLAVASVALEVLESGEIAGNAWEPFSTDVTAQVAWIYDPRDDSMRLLDDGGASLATVWASAHGSGKLLFGYLDDDWVLNGAAGAVRPALWQRSRARGETDFSLTVLPVPESVIGFGIWAGNTRGALVGAGSAGDGTLHAFHYSR